MVKLEPEEAQALADAMRPAGVQPPPSEVELRDFHKPRRLSPPEVEALRKRVFETLPEIETALKSFFRGDHRLKLEEVGEIASEGLFADLKAPMALMRFTVRGQPGWVLWDTAAALAALEIALGQNEISAREPRAFTSVEKIMLRRVLSALVERTAQSLGLHAEAQVVVDSPELVGHWRDGGAKADPQRLSVQLAFEGPGGASRMRIFLPTPQSGAAPVEPPSPKMPLPGHLDEVRVEVAACLGSTEIRLSELLEIEIGDVVPLGVRVGTPLSIVVEDQSCMQAELGQAQGRLAARVSRVERPKSGP